MKFFRDLSFLCACFLLFAFVGLATASPPSAKARAKAALALAECEEPTAKPEKAKTKAERPACHSDVETALAQASKAEKPVVVWVGMTCEDEPTIRDALDNAVHCHSSTYHNDSTPRILIMHGESGTWEFSKTSLSKYNPQEISGYLDKSPSAIVTGGPPPTALPATTAQRFTLANCPNGRCPQR